MITCRNCRWIGAKDERKWGACPKCGRRKFTNELEIWTSRLAWAAFVGLLAYILSRVPLGG
jgi:hypothetical protein